VGNSGIGYSKQIKKDSNYTIKFNVRAADLSFEDKVSFTKWRGALSQ